MGSRKIKAAVVRRAGAPLRIETLELEGPREDEALVRIAASGICHTDISFIEDWSGPPAVLGHEASGIVEEAGSSVKGFSPGDHVVLSYESCGRCAPCKKGRPFDCVHFWEANFGMNRLDGSNALSGGVRGHFFGQSSFATYCLATARNMVKVAKDLPLPMLAPLGCGIQTGAGTVMHSFNVRAGQSIAVFGTGTVGLAAVMAARLRGAEPIIGVDIVPMRLELASLLGATHVIDARKEDSAARIKALTGRSVDFTLDTTGDLEMADAAVEVLNSHGVAGDVTGAATEGPLPGKRKLLSIIQGDSVPQKFIPEMIRLHEEGRFPFERLLRFYAFRDINRAISDAKRGVAIKPVLRMEWRKK